MHSSTEEHRVSVASEEFVTEGVSLRTTEGARPVTRRRRVTISSLELRSEGPKVGVWS